MNVFSKGGVYDATNPGAAFVSAEGGSVAALESGQSLHEIGRAFGKSHVVIQFSLARHGGIVPAARRRSLRTLTLAEREEISRGIAGGSSIRQIAKGLQRAVSTVSRDVARHGGRPQYRANDADQQAWESALRPKTCLLAIHEQLRTIVASKLNLPAQPVDATPSDINFFIVCTAVCCVERRS